MVKKPAIKPILPEKKHKVTIVPRKTSYNSDFYYFINDAFIIVKIKLVSVHF